MLPYKGPELLLAASLPLEAKFLIFMPGIPGLAILAPVRVLCG